MGVCRLQLVAQPVSKFHIVPGCGLEKGPLFPAQDPLSLGIFEDVRVGSTSYFQHFQNLKETLFYL